MNDTTLLLGLPGVVVDRVEVDDHAIRIVGDRATLEQAMASDQNANPNVRSFVRKWRTRHDSNV